MPNFSIDTFWNVKYEGGFLFLKMCKISGLNLASCANSKFQTTWFDNCQNDLFSVSVYSCSPPPWNPAESILIDVLFPLKELAVWLVVRMHVHRLCSLVLTVFSCGHLLFHFIMQQISRCFPLTIDWMVVCIFTHFLSNFV